MDWANLQLYGIHPAPPQQFPSPLLGDLMTNSSWHTANEAAAYLQVKPATLLMWAREGKVKGYILSGTRRHVWRFQTTDLDAMLTAPSIAPTEKIQ